MGKITPAYYLGLRPCNLCSREYRHIWLYLYWLFYLIAFTALENWQRPSVAIYSRLDDYIPFCSAFIVPYYIWFAFMVVMMLYTFFFNLKSFRQFMWFIILTYTFTLIVYLIFPNRQDLRPIIEPDGVFNRIVLRMWSLDTNTNVCPSIHVIGSVVVSFTAANCEQVRRRRWLLWSIHIMTVLICMSTVFLKQHSIIDVVAGLAVSAVFYWPVYGNNRLARLLTEVRENSSEKELATV